MVSYLANLNISTPAEALKFIPSGYVVVTKIHQLNVVGLFAIMILEEPMPNHRLGG